VILSSEMTITPLTVTAPRFVLIFVRFTRAWNSDLDCAKFKSIFFGIFKLYSFKNNSKYIPVRESRSYISFKLTTDFFFAPKTREDIDKAKTIISITVKNFLIIVFPSSSSCQNQ